MTTTENDLRDALRLLEQRAPEVSPDVRDGAAPRRRFGHAALLVSAAAVVLLAAGLGLFLGLGGDRSPQQDRHTAEGRPSSSHSARPTDSTQSAEPTKRATLKVLLTLTGGPVRLDGKQALDHTRQPHTTVTVVDQDGLRTSARTDSRGVAVFRLAPGRYRYGSYQGCGSSFAGRRAVHLTAGTTTVARLDCVVP